jgi:hypothetical protein
LRPGGDVRPLSFHFAALQQRIACVRFATLIHSLAALPAFNETMCRTRWLAR